MSKCGPRLSPDKRDALRVAVRSLIARGIVPANRRGHRLGLQSELARYFGVTRQRVSQVWAEERERAA